MFLHSALQRGFPVQIHVADDLGQHEFEQIVYTNVVFQSGRLIQATECRFRYCFKDALIEIMRV